jgi:hypothetical protein
VRNIPEDIWSAECLDKYDVRNIQEDIWSAKCSDKYDGIY